MKQNYIVIKNFLTEDEKKYFSTYSKVLMDTPRNFDSQGGACIAKYGSTEFDALMVHKKQLMENATKLKLLPTYSYIRIYNKYSVLKKHTDRPSCEISVSVHLDSCKTIKWPLIIEDKEIFLEPGDGVIYKGIQNSHWRNEFLGDWYSQVFLHYVDANGSNVKHIMDQRIGLGINKNGGYNDL